MKKTITIIGAGMMGSALAYPAFENGNEVRLVGTPLDRDIIDGCLKDTWRKVQPRVSTYERFKSSGADVFTTNLDASPVVEKTLELAAAKDAYLCAICAAPLVLGKRGYLVGKRATCFPGFEEYLVGATVGGKVIRDGKIITAAGMGVAQEFGLEMISALVSPEKAGEIRAAIQSL